MKVIYSYIVRFRRKMCATVLAGVRDRLLDETKIAVFIEQLRGKENIF